MRCKCGKQALKGDKYCWANPNCAERAHHAVICSIISCNAPRKLGSLCNHHRTKLNTSPLGWRDWVESYTK